MSEDPRRWREDPLLDGELREWLRSAPGSAPLPAGTRRAVEQRLEASLTMDAAVEGADAPGAAARGTPPAPNATGAAVAPKLALSAAKLAGTAGLIGALITAGWIGTRSDAPAVAPGRDARDTPAQAAGAAAEPATPPALAPAREAATGRAAAEAAAAPPLRSASPPQPARKQDTVAPLQGGAAGIPARSDNTLREEVRLLRSARELLDQDAARAAQLLNEYAARFPNGALKAEYAALAARLKAVGAAPGREP